LGDQFEQPPDAIGLGIRDLAWDGDYLFGSSNSRTIFVITPDGQTIDAINGPYNPCLALTSDRNYCLWVGRDTDPLVKIDYDGQVLATINHALTVRALAWNPEALDEFNLLMFVTGGVDRPVSLYAANPSTGEVRFAADLTRTGDELPGDGLSVTGLLNRGEWTLVGLVKRGSEQRIKTWHLGYMANWISHEPTFGEVRPAGAQNLNLTFHTAGYDDAQRLQADIRLDNNGSDPVIYLPVTLDIGNVEVPPDGMSDPPRQFAVHQPFPNPFNSRTSVWLDLPRPGSVSAAIYSLDGRLVRELSPADFGAGRRRIDIDAGGLAAGIYIVRIQIPEQAFIVKMALVR
jgi:hypothetical protein